MPVLIVAAPRPAESAARVLRTPGAPSPYEGRTPGFSAGPERRRRHPPPLAQTPPPLLETPAPRHCRPLHDNPPLDGSSRHDHTSQFIPWRHATSRQHTTLPVQPSTRRQATPRHKHGSPMLVVTSAQVTPRQHTALHGTARRQRQIQIRSRRHSTARQPRSPRFTSHLDDTTRHNASRHGTSPLDVTAHHTAPHHDTSHLDATSTLVTTAQLKPLLGVPDQTPHDGAIAR